MEKINLTFLGTSGALPSPSRSHPSIHLNYKKENILIDCGENTQVQLRKSYLSPHKLTRILITHWHGDHVLGLPGLLQTLALIKYPKTLYIYGPKGTKRFFKHMLQAFKFKEKYDIKIKEVSSGKVLETEEFIIKSQAMSHGIPCNAYSFQIKDRLRINKSKLKKAKIPATSKLKKILKGKSITINKKKYTSKELTYTEPGKKITFVIDTSQNKKIPIFAKNSDLLISDSTFDSKTKQKAKQYKHLTAKQAAENAKKAKVKQLILTNLSSKHEKNPKVVLSEAKKIFKNASIAKDLLKIQI